MIRKFVLTLALLAGAPCLLNLSVASASEPVRVAFSPGNAESVVVAVIGEAKTQRPYGSLQLHKPPYCAGTA